MQNQNTEAKPALAQTPDKPAQVQPAQNPGQIRAGKIWGMLKSLPLEQSLPIAEEAHRVRQAGRLRRQLYMTITGSSKLMDCSDPSLASAGLVCAELNLEPGSLGNIWLIPRRGQCTVQIGAYGFVTLARRAGVVSVWAEDVCENDFCEYVAGSSAPQLVHKIDMKAWDKRGAVVGTYAYARLADGSTSGTFMSIQDLDRARKMNPAQDTPWDDWAGEMRKKTAIKRAAKLWPQSKELAVALTVDNATSTGKALPAHLTAATPDQAPEPETQAAPRSALDRFVEAAQSEPEPEGEQLNQLAEVQQHVDDFDEPPDPVAVETTAEPVPDEPEQADEAKLVDATKRRRRQREPGED